MADRPHRLKLYTAPTEEPVTTAEAKLHLRVSHSDEDTHIARLVAAARRRCETETRRALVTQTWDLTLQDWPCDDRIILPLPPAQSITSITYVDSDGVTQTIASSVYKLSAGTPGIISLKDDQSWPSGLRDEADPITVRFVAGYGAASTVPESLKAGILMLVGTLYENREYVTLGTVAARIPEVVEALWATEAWGSYV
jgi:uncharacterized phiE125 gp8 family phage protein